MKYRKHASQATKRPSKIFAAHKTMLKRRLQDETAPRDSESLKALEQKWQKHYGQYLPIEIARLFAKGCFGDAFRALGHFVSALPASAIGAGRFLFSRARQFVGFGATR
jgi:hypothetical protein